VFIFIHRFGLVHKIVYWRHISVVTTKSRCRMFSAAEDRRDPRLRRRCVKLPAAWVPLNYSCLQCSRTCCANNWHSKSCRTTDHTQRSASTLSSPVSHRLT